MKKRSTTLYTADIGHNIYTYLFCWHEPLLRKYFIFKLLNISSIIRIARMIREKLHEKLIIAPVLGNNL